MQAHKNRFWRLWWPFVCLCLLHGTRWMLSDALPGSSTTLGSASLGCGSAAALFLLLLRPREAADRRQVARAALGGALLLLGPMVTLLGTRPVSAASLTISLALTPVVIAVAEAATDHASESVAGRLWPGLAAIAGLLLILTQPSLSDPVADVLLLLAPMMTGCGAVLLLSAPQNGKIMTTALLGGCAALAFAAGGNLALHLGVWPGMPGLASGLDAAEALLVVLSLQRVGAARWSAQFTIVPLLVLLEGMALMHSAVPARVMLGLLLLLAASLGLLIPPPDQPNGGLRASRADTAGVE